MNYLTLKNEVLLPSKKIVITTHQSPDGDAIGSSLGLYHILKTRKFNSVNVIVPDEFPSFLSWMKDSDKIIQFDKAASIAKKLILEADIIFSLDYNSLRRVGEIGEQINKSSAVKILIDHHQESEDFANFQLTKTTASSTAELIYEFVENLEWLSSIDRTVGECIYTGLLTDTGSFRFPSTSKRTHEVVASLMDKGVVPSEVYQNVFDTSSIDRLRLLGYTLYEKMEILPDYHAAIIGLSLEELNEYNFQKGDTEGFVNYPLSVKDIQFSAFVSEKESGKVRISFRSKGDFDVNKFARAHFNGGGHINAAGGSSDLSVKETIHKIKEVLSSYK